MKKPLPPPASASPPDPQRDAAPAPHLPHYEFRQLAGNHPEIQIAHQGQIYRLRVTRNGKLILNK